ncbi:hypothetical protein JGUZn3_05820 [Entomobacter blattae]|uniref:Uncharacterized protein n=1 Tax=Entomobacter blattae TaxID=2762277 RepID=A0A7H1NPW7_9PROT|nr:hypothetical protein JGUZn3_05820 [Entomobacter blattae]
MLLDIPKRLHRKVAPNSATSSSKPYSKGKVVRAQRSEPRFAFFTAGLGIDGVGMQSPTYFLEKSHF